MDFHVSLDFHGYSQRCLCTVVLEATHASQGSLKGAVSARKVPQINNYVTPLGPHSYLTACALPDFALTSVNYVLMTSPWRPRSSGEGDNGSGEWKRARQEMRDLVKTELTASSPKVVLVDDNNYYRSMRHEYYQLARDMGVGFCQIFMQVTIFSCPS